MTPFYGCGNGSSGKLSHLPRVAQGDSSRAETGIWDLSLQTQSPPWCIAHCGPGKFFLPLLCESLCSGVWGKETSEGPLEGTRGW